jgi:hypothetical protein
MSDITQAMEKAAEVAHTTYVKEMGNPLGSPEQDMAIAFTAALSALKEAGFVLVSREVAVSVYAHLEEFYLNMDTQAPDFEPVQQALEAMSAALSPPENASGANHANGKPSADKE